jgi:hypothetical protein
MEVFVLLVSLLMVTNMAQANVTPNADDTANCTLQGKRITRVTPAERDRFVVLCAQQRAASRQVRTLESQIDREEDRQGPCYGNRRTWNPRTWFGNALPTQAAIDECTRNVAAAEAEATRLGGDLRTVNDGITAAQAQSDAIKATSEERSEGSMNREFNNLRISVYDDRIRIGDAQAKLSKMSRAVDNSALGLYLRDRMAGLLNSPKMCEVVKACPNPSTVAGRDLNSVFNGSAGTSAADAIGGAAGATAPATPDALVPITTDAPPVTPGGTSQ